VVHDFSPFPGSPDGLLDPCGQGGLLRCSGPVVGTVFVRIGVFQILPQFADGCRIRGKVKRGPALNGKQVAPHGLRHCRVRLTVVLVIVRRDSLGEEDLAGPDHLDDRRVPHRTNVDEPAVGSEEAVDFFEGMHHALMGHSTQRPGQDSRVEQGGRALEGKIFKRDGVKLDASTQGARQVFLRLPDAVCEWIDSDDVRGAVREPPRQPAVAAANLQHMLTVEIEEIEQGVGLIFLRVNSNCQSSTPRPIACG